MKKMIIELAKIILASALFIGIIAVCAIAFVEFGKIMWV